MVTGILKSLKAFLKIAPETLVGKLNIALGRYDSLKNIRAEEIERLVFVCRGNVCRSPYAEAAAKSLGTPAASCGVDVSRSAPAELTAIRAAHLRKIDLSQHMSQSIYNIVLNSSDCLVAMDPSHLPVAREVAANAGCQTTLIGLWRRTAVIAVEDPYGKPVLTFTGCFDEIDEALVGLTPVLKRRQ